MPADPTCTGDTDDLQRNGATLPRDHLVYLPGGRGPKPSAENDPRIRADWMSFNRYRQELYDRPTPSLDLKARMVKSEVVEALLYGCATWTPL